VENLLLIPLFLIIGVVLLIIGLVVAVMYGLRYKTASSNEALLITGPNLGDPKKDNRIFIDENGRSMKIIRGGGDRLKMFQRVTPIPLNSFQIQLTTPAVITKEGVPIVADAMASVKVADSLLGTAKYAEQFLGKKQDEIEKEITNVLGPNLRAILSKLSVEEINNNRESFSHQVEEIAQIELDNMGFELTSFGLDDIRDADPKNGYLENLGRARIAEVRKEADKAESDSEKETRIHKVRNDQKSQEEENQRKTEIAESRKQLAIKEAQIKEETERARAKSEQAYELEKARLAQEVKEEDMQILIIEKKRSVELEEEELKRRKSQADADAYDIKAKAEAEAEKARINGETNAQIERAAGMAKADVTREQGKAEAESKELMAAAMEKYGEAAVMEMFIKMLPDFAEKIAAPLSSISEIKIIDSGNGSGSGASKVAGNVTSTMMNIQESLKESTGIDIKSLLESYVSKDKASNSVPAPQPNGRLEVTDGKEESAE
jgi:flotillin